MSYRVRLAAGVATAATVAGMLGAAAPAIATSSQSHRATAITSEVGVKSVYGPFSSYYACNQYGVSGQMQGYWGAYWWCYENPEGSGRWWLNVP
jgi:hypothetical protein